MNVRFTLLAATAASVAVIVACQGNTAVCTNPSDCGAGSSICLASGTCASACTVDSQCAAHERCSAGGGCVAKDKCGAPGDCPGGKACDPTQTCVEPCQKTGCAADQKCGAKDYCVPSTDATGKKLSCGGELFGATAVEANFLITLDKSGSMNDQLGGVSKWNIAVGAMKALTTKYQDKIRFGLQLFPGTVNCSVPAASVGVGPTTATPIGAALDASAPQGNTPIAAAVTAAGANPGLNDPNRGNYVMLVTDGMETCNGRPVDAVKALFTKNIKTYVVGFGGGVDANQLANMAVSGGTARSVTPRYYQADDQATLQAAMDRIAQGAIGCDFKLAKAPPDPAKLFVYVSGQQVARDPSRVNGWDYNPATNRIAFYGPHCDALIGNPSFKVQVVYGCADDVLVETGGPGGPVFDAGTPIVNDGGIIIN